MIPARSTFLGDVPGDAATPAQRARMAFLGTQLHALGLSIQQATQRGDTATVAKLRVIVDGLYAEQLALQKTIIQQGNAIKKQVDSGAYDSPLEQIASSLKSVGIGAVVGLAALAYLASRS